MHSYMSLNYLKQRVKPHKIITVNELAAHYGVHRNTVREWVQAKIVDLYNFWSVYDFLKYMDAYRKVIDKDKNMIVLVSVDPNVCKNFQR